ncbi:hypothetical protein MMYC01_204432 [Madurella mycetomatis]|uniref:Uncharacterized protein n=1 Tax=Madurella mycetomatis TaxID=100816 RepID=A0A175W569_9PEZI|nr:hypothetical protein MMYC01_204432 [Madurella mycetomatis]
MPDDDDDDDDGPYYVPDHVGFVGNVPRSTPQHKQAQHEAWLPFERFIGQLPGPKDQVYACKQQISACVLAALHQHHPKSRLHEHDFGLRNVHRYPSHLEDIDADELALATSPCLYSIDGEPPIATCCAVQACYSSEAVASMVSGYGLALRRLTAPSFVAGRLTRRLLGAGRTR